MSDFLSVKEFADIAGVSSQRIYKLISTKSNGLATDIQQYCKVIKGRKHIHSDALKLFNDDSTAVNKIQPDSTTGGNDENNLLKSEFDVLKSENDSLRDKIEEKENQINLLKSQLEELKADKAKLNDRLDKAETNISNLTTALTAAQALHGMDKQTKVIEVKEQANVSEPTENENQDQIETPEHHKKLSFLARLFKRN